MDITSGSCRVREKSCRVRRKGGYLPYRLPQPTIPTCNPCFGQIQLFAVSQIWCILFALPFSHRNTSSLNLCLSFRLWLKHPPSGIPSDLFHKEASASPLCSQQHTGRCLPKHHYAIPFPPQLSVVMCLFYFLLPPQQLAQGLVLNR